MTRSLRAARHRVPALLGAVLMGSVLVTGCGSDDSSGGAAPEPPTQEELDSYVESATTDVESVSAEVVKAYQQDQEFPDSAEGLASLSDGNHLGTYDVQGDTATVCVEHRVDGEDVAFSSYLVNAAGNDVRSSPLSHGTSTGCLD